MWHENKHCTALFRCIKKTFLVRIALSTVYRHLKLCCLVSGGSSERKVPPAAAVVSPSSCQFEELEQLLHHVTPISPSSHVTSPFQFSPVKPGWSSAPSLGHTKVHSLPSTEFRRDSFPPYVCSALKHSTAVVTPSLARTRSTVPATTLVGQLAASSSLQFLSSPSDFQNPPSASAVRLFTPRATLTASKVTASLARRYAEPTSIMGRTGAGSLLAPCSAAGSGISYSLALSSSLTSSSRPSAGQNNSYFPAVQSLSHSTHLRHLHPTVLSSSNTQQQQPLFRENIDTHLELKNPRESSQMYNNFGNTLRRMPGASFAMTAAGNTTFASSCDANLVGYSAYRGLNQISRPSCAQYRAGLFTSPSAPSVSTQQHRLQATGRFMLK